MGSSCLKMAFIPANIAVHLIFCLEESEKNVKC